MFRKKIKAEYVELLNCLDFMKENNLELCYFDNSNVGPVETGKIPKQIGYYIKKHKEKISGVQIDRPFFIKPHMAILWAVNYGKY